MPRSGLHHLHRAPPLRTQALSGEAAPHLRGPHNRQYTFITDVVPTIATAPFVAPPGTVVNVGADELTAAAEVIAAVAAAAGVALPTEEQEEAGGVHHAQVRSSCSRRVFAFVRVPRRPLSMLSVALVQFG